TAARRAARIIVPSKATRDELERVLKADPTKIDVAYHGVDHRLFHRPDPQQVLAVANRLGLHGKPYIAFLGLLEPRKNVASLITGWAGAVADLDNPPALVLGGGGGWSEEVDVAVASVPPHLRLIRPGYLRFSDLPGFFGGATVVAFPSRGEGFGLPVLEAMACGAPVLTRAPCSLSSHAARTTRGNCPRRGPGYPAATADPVRAQAPAAHRGRAVPGPPAGPGGGRRRHPRGPGYLLQGGDVRRGARGRRAVRAVDRLRAGGARSEERRV